MAHAFHSVPIVFGIGVGTPGEVEYQIDLGDEGHCTICSTSTLREAVKHAKYDEVNFCKRATRILIHLPYTDQIDQE